MKSMNYSLIRTICALVIGLVLVLWPDAAINYIVITIGVLFLSEQGYQKVLHSQELGKIHM